MGMFLEFKKKSGKRDSDPRPQPWQGCALPTELLPHLRSRILHRFLEMSRILKKKLAALSIDEGDAFRLDLVD